ncbi:MAG: LamG domain-containing protein, partial [bacterium]|nr:LamG domain-containing protein [bacterium]
FKDFAGLAAYWLKEFGLISHLKLDETDGDIAYDSVGENDAVVIGDAMWQPEAGLVRGALQFYGIDGYLSAPFILDPSIQPYSAYIWIKGDQPRQTIISQQGALGDWLYLDAAGTLTSSLLSPLPPVTSDVVITDDRWHHVGLVVDGSGISLYVDDAEVARTDITPFFAAKGDLQIGAGNNLEPGTFWSGLIDDVRIYDRAVAP